MLRHRVTAAGPWCSGQTCQPVTLEIAGSNPVGPATSLQPMSPFADLNPLRCPTDGSTYVDMADPRRRMDEYYFIQVRGRPIVGLHLG
jgi:hypothetical protein